MNGAMLIFGTLFVSMFCALLIGRFIKVGDREPTFTIDADDITGWRSEESP